MKRLRVVLIGFLVVLVLAGASFVVWAETSLGPMLEAVAALQSDAEVRTLNPRRLVGSISVVAASAGPSVERLPVIAQQLRRRLFSSKPV